MKLNEFYVAVDGNYEDAMERLQNEMFVVKFLRMLPRDGSMMLLEKAMADGRANDAFRAVHTLKGIALNLSLTKLAAACSQLTEALRGMGMRRAFDPAQAQFGGIGTAEENISIGSVIHKTFLRVDANGTKAGAATAVDVTTEGAAEYPHSVYLERPFVYMIVDRDMKLPIFLGVLTELPEV